MFIGAALFALIVAFVMWYYSMAIMNALWNSKGFKKARKDAIEAIIHLEKVLQDMENTYSSNCDDEYDTRPYQE